MPDAGREVTISINGQRVNVRAGTSVAAAIWRNDTHGFRKSVAGEMRGPLCGMGICFECRAVIDGVGPQRTCQTLCTEGMEVRTDA